MKLVKYILGVSALCLMLVSASGVKAQALRLKVASWNVLSFEQEDKTGEREGFPVKPFVDLINKINPDVMVLNEFETMTGRMNKEKMAELAASLGMYAYFIESYPKEVGFYGNVILSKYPFVSTASHKFTYKNHKGEGYYDHNDGDDLYEYGSDQRSIGYADIMVPTLDNSMRIVRIVGTHFDHVSGTSCKTKYQEPEAIKFANLETPEYPTVMMGDLNIHSLWELYRIPSFSDTAANDWLDYILTFPKDKWEVTDSGTMASGNLSDHNAIYATLEIK